MNWKAWLPLAIAIVLGLVAARMAMNVVRSQTPQQAASNLTPIVVASREIEPGTTLLETDLKLGKVDAADVPVGAFMSPQQLANRVTKVGLSPNQAILPSLLADEGSGYGAGATLPKGMRAITVEINDVSGVAGFIQPSCRVDIVATIQADGKALAKTILENIPVFAIGSRTGPAPTPMPGQPVEPARTITLLVTPEQAEKLELATASSRVRLLLRNGRDLTTTSSNGMTVAELKGQSSQGGDIFAPTNASLQTIAPASTQPSAEATYSPKQQWTVEIIKAGQTSTQIFDLPEKKTVPPATPNEPAHGNGIAGGADGWMAN